MAIKLPRFTALLILTLAAVLCFTGIVHAQHEGDVDDDGFVTVKDALHALRVLIDLEKPAAGMLSRYDVAPLKTDGTPGGDGRVDLTDVLLILRVAVGLPAWRQPPPELLVTADNLTREFDAANPLLSWRIDGFKPGDDAGIVQGAPLLTTAATRTSGAGTYAITVDLADLNAAGYTFRKMDGTLTVTKASQTITGLAATTATFGDAPFPLNATASSGLPVSYESDNVKVCTIKDGLINITGIGKTVITASQAGDAAHDAAVSVQRQLTVTLRPSPIDSTGLESYWPLDGDWKDLMGRHDLASNGVDSFSPAPEIRSWGNLAYGPRLITSGTGASNSSFTSLAEDQGVTLEGWAWLEDDRATGVLFGFYSSEWGSPQLSIGASGGFLWVQLGAGNSGAALQYTRIGDNTCWHHIALVLPKDFRTGIPFRFYLDGVETAPLQINSSATGTASLDDGVSLFGSPFTLGLFDASGSQMKVDEVRVWRRALSATEVVALAAPGGTGVQCTNSPPPTWAPGLRFVPPAQAPVPTLDLGVHVLTDNSIAIITDPNPWLKSRISADCGEFLRSVEANLDCGDSPNNWLCPKQYGYATKEVILQYRPGILAALPKPGHFIISGTELAATELSGGSLWPQATREFRIPRQDALGGEFHGDSAEVVYYSYFTLPFHLQAGASYRITDEWGNLHDFVYNEDRTISWALKVNQVGYFPDAREKYGYLGSWTGPGGALDLTRFNGGRFQVVKESDDSTSFTGAIAFRKDETLPLRDRNLELPFTMSGEMVYQLDFSAFTTPGRYYLRVPGVGRSWSFEIGQNAMGEAFYVHTRGLYHQRCATLDAKYTPWARGDNHHPIYRAAFPSMFEDYSDHSAEGWGFLYADGNYGYLGSWFNDEYSPVFATETREVIPGLQGGWHDAGDFDQNNETHLYAVRDLVMSYLMFPDNFTDGQLNIPESGNGIPDILDEAAWEVEVVRLGQEADGRAALWINMDGHPPADGSLVPERDHTPYYLSVASRESSVKYAEYAALLARGLQKAGATEKAQLYSDSAVRAYAFGTSTFDRYPRVTVPMTLFGKEVTWSENPVLTPETKLRALIQLWLATGDPAYQAALATEEMTNYFVHGELPALTWRTNAFELIDPALMPEKFPAGWGESARATLIANAADWRSWMEADGYRHVWYPPGEGYFALNSYGVSEFTHVRNLIAAWRLTGDENYRTGALLAVDWMSGANPQGRSYTTGLGQNYVVHPLHHVSDLDGIADPVPGITIYGVSFGVAWAARSFVYGLFDAPDPGMGFNGSALAQLPPPWDDTKLPLNGIADVLTNLIPVWRNLVNMETSNVSQMEFTVEETISQAAAVTGCLMGPGWTPSEALKNRQPKSAAELRDAIWFQP